jgi:hypothetical protein
MKANYKVANWTMSKRSSGHNKKIKYRPNPALFVGVSVNTIDFSCHNVAPPPIAIGGWTLD